MAGSIIQLIFLINININAPAVEQEFRTHEEWKKETKLMATPTILINGYELPDVYKIEDLIFFKDLRIEM